MVNGRVISSWIASCGGLLHGQQGIACSVIGISTPFAVPARRPLGGEHGLRLPSVHSRDNFVEFAAFAEFHAHTAVAREAAGAGQDQVSQARESGHGLGLCPAGDRQSSYLRQPAGNERGGSILAKAEPFHHSGGDGDDVFERSAQFDPDDVIVPVNANLGIAEFAAAPW